MAVYIDGVSKMRSDEAVRFDIFQDQVKRQTVSISVVNARDFIVIVNGKELRVD